jgi:hypothetical protein
MGWINTFHVKKLWDHISDGIMYPENLRKSEYWLDLIKKAIKVEEFRELMKKTYLVGVLLFALGGIKAMGWIDEGTYQAILAILSGAGMMTLRAAVAKNGINK